MGILFMILKTSQALAKLIQLSQILEAILDILQPPLLGYIKILYNMFMYCYHIYRYIHIFVIYNM